MSDSDFGKIGRSMLLATGGVGGILELRVRGTSLESVMIAGLDFWDAKGLPVIREPQLEKNLGKTCFRGAPEIPKERDGKEKFFISLGVDPHIPAYRFPRWLQCRDCNRLGKEEHDRFVSKTGQQPKCRACNGAAIPVRLIVSCSESSEATAGHPGHLDDFPWTWWAHKRRQEGICEKPDLYLESAGTSVTLAGLVVECKNCKSKESLKEAFWPSAISSRCTGERPWLRDKENCSRPVRAMMRGASNVYFPVVASALSIPPYSDQLFREIQKHQALIDAVNSPDHIAPVETLVALVKNSDSALQRYTEGEITDALKKAAGADGLASKSEAEQREAERKALIEGRGQEGDFIASPVKDLSESPMLSPHLAYLVKAHALREVRALRGFNRVEPSTTTDPYNAACAPISLAQTDWLPAIEVRGEGVYLELDPDRILSWQASPPVTSRREQLKVHVEAACRQDGRPFSEVEFPSAGCILVHTLSHLLINQLTLDCGYSTASLRERLYIKDQGSERFFGLLIYTATPGADGTLGGLVGQGNIKRMQATFEAALQKAVWCASDPLCMESKGQGPNATNMAACHACCVVSETSCERGNQYLDRGLVVGSIEASEVGFFSGSAFFDSMEN
jgi:hypothetical protein